MKRYRHQAPDSICTDWIEVVLDREDRIREVTFRGGASFNRCGVRLKGIARRAVGCKAEEVAELWCGRDCGHKGTSCEDQMARALRQAVLTEKE